MNDQPKQTLCELVTQYGTSVGEDPRRLKGLLADHCGGYKREINVLVAAASEGVPAALLGSDSGTPPQVLFARLSVRMHEELALAEPACQWAVQSWAIALGVISTEEVVPEIRCPHCNTKRRKTKNRPVKPFTCSKCKSKLRLEADNTVVIVQKAMKIFHDEAGSQFTLSTARIVDAEIVEAEIVEAEPVTSPDSPATDQMDTAEVIQAAFRHVDLDDSIYLAPDIPESKIRGALTYAPDVEPSNILVLCDNTAFEDAKGGFILTSRAIHWCNSAGEGKKSRRFSEVGSTTTKHTRNIFVQSAVVIGEEQVEINTWSVASRNEVADALANVLQTVSGQR